MTDKKRIVIVEDDEMLLKSLCFFLKSSGYEITTFDNGLDAIDYINLNYQNIDLIVTDLNLPFAGGRQVIHSTRQIGNADTKIIVLSSSAEESTELQVFELGADDFISKPFSPIVLLKLIEKILI